MDVGVLQVYGEGPLSPPILSRTPEVLHPTVGPAALAGL